MTQLTLPGRGDRLAQGAGTPRQGVHGAVFLLFFRALTDLGAALSQRSLIRASESSPPLPSLPPSLSSRVEGN
eukprot:862042-Rhodomonas_salina.1